jgi:hypothetical protein
LLALLGRDRLVTDRTTGSEFPMEQVQHDHRGRLTDGSRARNARCSQCPR